MFKKIKIISKFLKTPYVFKEKKKLYFLQKEKLNNLLKNLNSKFYPESITLKDFPIINKTIFMKNFNTINSYGFDYDKVVEIALKAENTRDFSPTLNNVTIGMSSGTSGNKGIFLVNEDERTLWAGYILKKMLPRPLLQKHKIAFFLRANSNLYETINSNLIKFEFFDLMIPIKEQIKKLESLNPTILIAPASVLKLIVLENINIFPKKIISVAEVLEEEDKIFIEKKYNQIVHQIYQATEGFIACTCEYGNLHINEDIVYIEKHWLNEEKTIFNPIITDFNRYSQPIIRYKLDDILHIEQEKCPCGSCFQRLKKIEGRMDDILKCETLEGEEYNLFPDFVRRKIISVEGVEEYKVQKENNNLHVSLKPLDKKELVEKSLQELYNEHNIKRMNHFYKEYIPEPLGNKRRRVINS